MAEKCPDVFFFSMKQKLWVGGKYSPNYIRPTKEFILRAEYVHHKYRCGHIMERQE